MNYLLAITALFMIGCNRPQVPKNCSGTLKYDCTAESEPDYGADIQRLQKEIKELYEYILVINEELDEGGATITEIQDFINQLLVRVVELESHLYIEQIIDPCGDGPGLDEIILEMSDGSLIVYFKESSSKEFLTKLTPGTYTTTDNQQCTFEVE